MHSAGLLAFLASLPIADSVVPPARPRLIVVITVDQLRPDYFTRWKSQLTGGLGQLANEGAFFTEGYQDHALTETAPGHATILSGTWPAHNGIIRNSEGVQDTLAPLIGIAGSGASPRRFRGTTLFDWLKAADPTARALSVSRKDRGAILTIGLAKEQVYWYQSGMFTTSRYYADTLPTWVQAFNARRLPFKAANMTWTPLLPDSAYLEPDSEPWENGGSNVVFPHRLPADSLRAALALPGVPAIDSLTLLFALDGFEALKLGRKGTDILAVSLSGTDAVGHLFGPDSRELHDQVLRLDRYLAWFIKRVTDRVGGGRDNVVVVLTSDHGVTSFPARTRAKGGTAYDVVLDTLITAVNAELDRVAATSRRWLEFESGMLLMRDNGRFAAMGIRTDSILDVLTTRILRVPGVARIIKPADLARADTASDPVARRWLHHLTPDASVALTVSLQPGSAWGDRGVPVAMHGQPSDDDAHVPIIFWGSGIRKGSYATRMNTVDIAPTLAALLGISPLSLVDGRARTDALMPRN
ncbi:MAG TPA: alkaline phosphatase family protein [Gemmatimonadales bacterium]|nr:alkaline phosphatase family protein [Gemmatimonadales bacterium]